MLRRKQKVLALGLVAASAPLLTAGAVTRTTSSGVSASSTIAEDVAVDEALTRIQSIMQDVAGSDLVASSISYEKNIVTIYTPRDLLAKLENALVQENGPLSISYVVPTFSVDTLTREGERIAGLPGVAWAGPNSDFTGLVVGVTDDAIEAVQLTKYPATVEHSDGVTSVARQNDSAPAYGGALIKNGTTACTAGIGVSYGGSYGFTTAAHCPAGTWKGGSGSTLGSTDSTKVSQSKDIRVVKAGTSSARVWTGAYNTTASYNVYHVSNPTLGQRICTSGSVSGGHCGNLYVRYINQYVTYGGVQRGPGFWIHSENAVGGYYQCSSMPGDSGAPAYTSIADGRLEIRGFVAAQDNGWSTVECSTRNPAYSIVGFPPSYRTYAINVTQALSAISVTYRTG